VYSLGVVAAGVAHELNNPISWLKASLELMRYHVQSIEQLVETSPIAPEADPYFKKMHDAFEKAESGVDRLFDIVRGISLPLSSRPPSEVVDLREALRVTLELVGTELRDTAKIESALGETASVLGSVTKVSQVLLNLIVNAMQALHSRSIDQNRIRVSLEVDAEWARVEVADNGPGVREADSERIFEPFFTTKEAGGMGLGLPICRQIATELGGSLEVSRDSVLGGALFTLRLPRHQT
jgi:signal transduction histidine kinase